MRRQFIAMVATVVACLVFSVMSSCGEDPVTSSGNDDVATGDDDEGSITDDGSGLPLDSDVAKEGDALPSDLDNTYPPDTDNPSQWEEEDADGDGVKNGDEGTGDTDGDGTPDYLDDESDGDGLADNVEAPSGIPVDTDKDGTPDFKDTDSDNDGISDGSEGTGDADSDGTANYRDTEADGDTLPDSIECAAQPCVDSDTDGTPDFLDPDSDGDGVPDIVEGNKDMDSDGKPSYLDDDADGDGTPDSEECPAQPCADTDSDGYPDFKDRDSDNDGLSDATELEIGTDPHNADSDGDGVDDNTEHAFGSDPEDPNSSIPENAYYYILPYNSDPVQDTLDFSTNIQKADIMIMVDLSGSMMEEHANLKQDINSVIISGVKAKIPDAAFGLAKFGTLEDTPYQLTQGITTDAAAVQTAVNTITDVGGSSEAAYEALYQAVTGAGGTYECSDSGGCNNVHIMAATTIPASNPGWRTEALPIVIMCTDEALQDYASDCNTHSKSETFAAMNAKNVKFIGVDSGSGAVMSGFQEISNATGSVDGNGNPFNYEINSDGTGLSNQIVDAVIALSKGIQIDVNTIVKSVPNDESVDTSLFVKAVVPNSADPADGYASKDQTTFYKVKPGTKVTFDVTFQNDIYDNQTTETKLFIANINVMGAGTLLDTRQVFILVPGIGDSGGER